LFVNSCFALLLLGLQILLLKLPIYTLKDIIIFNIEFFSTYTSWINKVQIQVYIVIIDDLILLDLIILFFSILFLILLISIYGMRTRIFLFQNIAANAFYLWNKILFFRWCRWTWIWL